jgi:hypothetical protein
MKCIIPILEIRKEILEVFYFFLGELGFELKASHLL